jgi:hypothetical protein
MFKVCKVALIMVFLTFSSCSLFNGGSKGKSSNDASMFSGAGFISVDSTVTTTRGDEIFSAVQANLSNSMENGAYKYGAKSAAAQTFALDKLRVLIGSCGTDSTKCNVNIFIDKGSNTMRPLFAIDPTATTQCDNKYKAYIKSTVMLSIEALGSASYYQYGPSTAISSWDSYCGDLTANTYRDLLCAKKADIQSSQKKASMSVNYGQLLFDAATSASTITITDVKFKDNDANNIVCITDMIKPSLWGEDRSAKKQQVSTFKVELEMVQ